MCAKLITLALDLGTSTGFAIGDAASGYRIESGTFVTAKPKEITAASKTGFNRRKDTRVERLHTFVADKIKQHSVTQLVFEDVQFCSSQLQCQLWAALRAAAWLAGNIDYHCVSTGTLKLFFAGKGNAKKEDMAAALLRNTLYAGQFTIVEGGVIMKSSEPPMRAFVPIDDNECDALALFAFAHAVSAGRWAWPYNKKPVPLAA